jgi:D-alanine-D-alanine ligase
MKVIVLHSKISAEATKDEEDVLIQVDAVSQALSDLGHDPAPVPFSIDLKGVMEELRRARSSFVFNLVESVEGSGRLIYFAPAVLDHLEIAYTGASTEAVFLTSNKLAAKESLDKSGIHTPPWISLNDERKGGIALGRPYIIKSVWEHASIGLDEGSVITPKHLDHLLSEMDSRREKLGGNCFAEVYIEGREFNLSLLAGEQGPEVLPPAEIVFDEYPEDKLKVVGYRAKWESESFEYQNTPRRFDFPDEDSSLIRRLESIAVDCWHLFALRGYARVDFRVDRAGTPWVLEVNTNPCLSPDAGYVAAADRAGLSFRRIIERIIRDSVPMLPGSDACFHGRQE